MYNSPSITADNTMLLDEETNLCSTFDFVIIVALK